ncbi:uncharacterized protein WM277_019226 [Molossus nigricans]
MAGIWAGVAVLPSGATAGVTEGQRSCQQMGSHLQEQLGGQVTAGPASGGPYLRELHRGREAGSQEGLRVPCPVSRVPGHPAATAVSPRLYWLEASSSFTRNGVASAGPP